MFNHILIPTDGTHLSEAALVHAINLAKVLGSRLNVLHVVTDFVGDASMEVPLLATTAREAFQQRSIGEAEAVLSGARRIGAAHDVAVGGHFVFAPDPYKAIIDEAERRGCDLIVMASHGRRGLESLLIGSETQKVLTHCRIPVLVVR